jgi:hypothetical protein
VGNVTSQHVGRLRRVFDRFGESHQGYPSLYWSHFLAALDWDDAEMWLEGAVHSRWSISQMRQQRWESNGAVESEQPQDEDVVIAEIDEDSISAEDDRGSDRDDDAPFDEQANSEIGASRTGSVNEDSEESEDGGVDEYTIDASEIAPVRPFESLSEMPDDLTEAFEAYKLAILRHKLAGWQEASRDDILASLEALKQLTLAPTEAEAAT